MHPRFLPFVLVASTSLSLGWSLQACSGDAADSIGTTDSDASADTGAPIDGDDGASPDAATPGDDAGTSDDARSSEDVGASDDASSSGDATTDAGCTDPVAADINGAEACKTLAFGVGALAFEASDPNGPKTNGGAIPAGIYDVSRAERDTPKGSWRETLVFDGTNKFTRTRQIDTGSGNGLGPVTHVAGTYTTAGNQITFATECMADGGKAGDTTLPYGVTKDACGRTSFFLTVTGARITYTQR